MEEQPKTPQELIAQHDVLMANYKGSLIELTSAKMVMCINAIKAAAYYKHATFWLFDIFSFLFTGSVVFSLLLGLAHSQWVPMLDVAKNSSFMHYLTYGIWALALVQGVFVLLGVYVWLFYLFLADNMLCTLRDRYNYATEVTHGSAMLFLNMKEEDKKDV